MAKDFYNLLPIHHLFNISFYLTDRFLLTDKVFRRVATNFFNDTQHNDNTRHNDKRHPKTVIQHDPKYRNDHDPGT